jgi:hypothetical protein
MWASTNINSLFSNNSAYYIQYIILKSISIEWWIEDNANIPYSDLVLLDDNSNSYQLFFGPAYWPSIAKSYEQCHI